MSKELEALDYLFEMHKKYAPTVDIEGMKCMSKESEKWFDSIIILKRDYEKLKKVLDSIKPFIKLEIDNPLEYISLYYLIIGDKECEISKELFDLWKEVLL